MRKTQNGSDPENIHVPPVPDLPIEFPDMAEKLQQLDIDDTDHLRAICMKKFATEGLDVHRLQRALLSTRSAVNDLLGKSTFPLPDHPIMDVVSSLFAVAPEDAKTKFLTELGDMYDITVTRKETTLYSHGRPGCVVPPNDLKWTSHGSRASDMLIKEEVVDECDIHEWLRNHLASERALLPPDPEPSYYVTPLGQFVADYEPRFQHVEILDMGGVPHITALVEFEGMVDLFYYNLLSGELEHHEDVDLNVGLQDFHCA